MTTLYDELLNQMAALAPRPASRISAPPTHSAAWR